MRILTSSSLKIKMTWAVSLLVSVILILVGAINYYLWRGELKKTISTQQDALVSALARQLDDKLISAQEQLTHFSRRIDQSVIENPHRLQEIMDEEDDVTVLFDGGLLLVSTTGKVIAEYPHSENSGSDHTDRAYFNQTIATGKPVISPPYISTPLKITTIAFTVPIFTGDGSMAAILVGSHGLDSSLIFSSLRDLKIGNRGYLYIIDRARNMVLHPDSKRIMEVLPSGLNAGLDRAIKGFEGTIENVNSRKINGLTSFKQLKSTDWILAAHNPLSEAYAPLHRAKLYALIILAGGILLSIVISRYVMARLTEPLIALIRHVREFPDKQGIERIFPVSCTDETGLLGTAFNGLVTQLEEQNRTIEDEKRFFGSLIQNTVAPMFVIDRTHTIIFWNNAIAKLTGHSSFQMVGTKRQWEPFYTSRRPLLADLVLDRQLQSINDYYTDVHSSVLQDGAYRAEGWYDNLGGERRYIYFEAAPILDTHQEIVAAVETLQDITHRKLSQENMNSQNLFLQEILDTIPNPVFYKDTKGAYIGCNNSFLGFLGCTREELIGKTVFDVLLEEQAAENDAQDRLIISERSSTRYESYARRYDGVSRLVLQTKAAFSRPDGSIGGVVGSFVDITEQRLLDEQIRKLSRAVEQSPVSIVMTDIDGNIEYVNPKFSQDTGYSHDEAIGKNPRILSSGETTREEYAEMWRTITSGREWRGEFHNLRKNGELYWEVASITPLTDKNSKIIGYLAVNEDITARKEAEAELTKNREELLRKHYEQSELLAQVENGKHEWEDTMDSISEMVLICNPFGVVNRCNRAVTTFTGLRYEEIINVDCMELFSNAGLVITGYDGTSGQLEFEGGQRHFELLSNELKQIGSDHIRGVVVTIHETTELLKMNEKLQKAYAELQQTQSQILQQEKMASIGSLAAGVAHEINNPMGFISSNLTSLGKYMEKIGAFNAALMEAVQTKGDPDTLATLSELRKKMKIDFILGDISGLLAESHDGAERVRRIVQDLKSFSHVDEAECKPFSINECLASTLNMARNEIKYVAEVEQEYDPELPLLNCYPQQLNQVFMNILVNAAHAIEGHGIIKIKTLHDADEIVVRISDSGKGIAPENLTRIFEPFFTTKDVGKGTGLGLSISYDIIKKHGGAISVESEVGVGTTFVIRLPLNHVFEAVAVKS